MKTPPSGTLKTRTHFLLHWSRTPQMLVCGGERRAGAGVTHRIGGADAIFEWIAPRRGRRNFTRVARVASAKRLMEAVAHHTPVKRSSSSQSLDSVGDASVGSEDLHDDQELKKDINSCLKNYHRRLPAGRPAFTSARPV